MRRELGIILAVLAALAAPARAQQPTYYTTAIAVPIAATPTDVFCLNGGPGMNTRLVRILTLGKSGAGGGNLLVTLVKRSGVNTGGMLAVGAGAPVALPAGAGQQPASASVRAWTANPTALAPLVGNLGAIRLVFDNQGNDVSPASGIATDFSGQSYSQPGLSGQEGFCLNLGGVGLTGLTMSVNIAWIEQRQ